MARHPARWVVVFTTVAADGLTGHRLMRHASARHGVVVPDPHVDLVTPARVQHAAAGPGLTVDQVEERSSPEPPGPDPLGAFSTFLMYGFAEPLGAASPIVRDTIAATYRDDHLAHTRAGSGHQDWLFKRAHFS